jgi:hypothetical protein
MTEAGERLEAVRISNDPEYLRAVMARAGEAPEAVLEATPLLASIFPNSVAAERVKVGS